MLTFAYGANLEIRAMLRRCRHARVVGRARLDGFRLVFRRFADLTHDEDAAVLGGLYALSGADQHALDKYEEVPRLYGKMVLPVMPEHGDAAVPALVYFMQNPDDEVSTPWFDGRAVAKRKAPRLAPPTPAYFAGLLRGYRDWDLDPKPLYKAKMDAARGRTIC
jgi:gamma-glutamylcyclotransferase (GGCT)/AIG2-like uncharacterized protein YtfP